MTQNQKSGYAFKAKMLNGQAMNSQDSSQFGLKRSDHSPFYNIFCNSPWGLYT